MLKYVKMNYITLESILFPLIMKLKMHLVNKKTNDISKV